MCAEFEDYTRLWEPTKRRVDCTAEEGLATETKRRHKNKEPGKCLGSFDRFGNGIWLVERRRESESLDGKVGQRLTSESKACKKRNVVKATMVYTVA